jgi:tripeptidyl-peptidase-1
VKLLPGRQRPASDDQYLKWLNYMLEKPTLPQTIDLGYGTPEPSIPAQEYAVSLCELFAQLGLLGVLVASGDDGVGAGECVDRSGNFRFYTYFPASCMLWHLFSPCTGTGY